jgi:hypothetical protein
MIQPRPISNSQLTAFKRSPAHWKQYVTEKRKQTEAMLMGSLAHCLALQKEKFKEMYHLLDLDDMPDRDRPHFRIKENAEWKKAEIAKAGDLTVIDSDQLTQAANMVEALYTNEVAVDYMKAGKEFESKLEWDCLGLKFLGIRDITADDFIADLKFVSNADPFVFQRTLFRDGVYRQGGMYLDGEMNGQFTGDPHKRVLFIAVEQTPPYGVSVNELDPEVINLAVNEYRMLAQQLKMCLDADYFPSYNHRSINGTFDVFLPTYIATE